MIEFLGENSKQFLISMYRKFVCYLKLIIKGIKTVYILYMRTKFQQQFVHSSNLIKIYSLDFKSGGRLVKS